MNLYEIWTKAKKNLLESASDIKLLLRHLVEKLKKLGGIFHTEEIQIEEDLQKKLKLPDDSLKLLCIHQDQVC